MGPCVLHLTVDTAPTIFKTTISRRIAGQRMQSHGIRGGHWGGVTGSLPGEHAAMSRDILSWGGVIGIYWVEHRTAPP